MFAKSEQYTKILFLLYKIKNDGTEKIRPFFNIDEKYPKMFHIWNRVMILEYTANIDINGKSNINGVFDKYNSIYIEGAAHGFEEAVEEKSEQEPYEEQEEEPEEHAEITDEQKIELLQEKQRDATMIFLKEIKQRKEEEEKKTKKGKR